jgi:predicted DNA binding CopG/RHH family protein
LAPASVLQGSLRLTVVAAKNVTIRLSLADLARARKQAERRGLRYQTYVKMLLHQALVADARRLA